MKKLLATHAVFLMAFVILFSVYRDWLSLSFTPFWWGTLMGFLLPYVDYVLYIYLLKPKETASQEVAALISSGKVIKAGNRVVTSFSDRKNLLMHNASFQILFLVFSVWMVTSGSLLGMGIVLAFMLHLILDQVTDYIELGNIDSWFEGFPINLDGQQRLWFLVGNSIIFLYLGFFF
jgi:hypothetical protein